MKESTDRQKEMVQAIINQRDMYRTLLAQSTPLPGESPQQPHHRRRGSGMEEVDAPSETESESRKELAEVKEQFAAYRKEKEKNDTMLQEQLEKLREESSEVKIFNAKLSSKVQQISLCVKVSVLAWHLFERCCCQFYVI